MPVTDADGNSYTEVTIGSQTWLQTNLKVTTLVGGTTKLQQITEAQPAGLNRTGAFLANDDRTNYKNFEAQRDMWYEGKVPAYCWYRNDNKVNSAYGCLYNFAAVAAGLGVPTGYRVATKADWDTLIATAGGVTAAGGYLKGTGTTYWKTPNTGALDTGSFTALPGGYRDSDGMFARLGFSGCFWCNVTGATYFDRLSGYSVLMTNDSAALTEQTSLRSCGFSVRCVHT